MRRTVPGRLPAAVAGLITALAGIWLMLGMGVAMGDYQVPGWIGADNAGPPITALIHGQWWRLVHVQTVMGLTSILWRAPFVGVATLLGAGVRVGYDIGAMACLLPVAGLVSWMTLRAQTWRQFGWAVVAGLAMLLGPATVDTVSIGHPEEVLTAVLATAAVLAAQADRRILAAVALGLSVGCKEWAIVAVPAVFIALPAGRRRAAVTAAAVTLPLTVILPLLDPTAFHRADATIGPIRTVQTISLWWPASTTALHKLPLGLDRTQATFIALSAAAAFVWAIGAGLRRRTSAASQSIDAMALLSLACTLRCLCDPSDLSYYLVAPVIPLAVWEAGTLRRLPIATLLLWLVVELGAQQLIVFGVDLPGLVGPPGIDAFLVAGLALAGYLTVRTFIAPPIAGATSPAATPRPRTRSTVVGLLGRKPDVAGGPSRSPRAGQQPREPVGANVAT